MFAKINILKIINNHLETLVNANTKKPSCGDLILFGILPVVGALFPYFFRWSISENALSTLIAIHSIFVGLLINVIVLIFDIVNRNNNNPIKRDLLNEVLANILFTILLSIASIVLALCTYIPIGFLKIFATTFIVYFTIQFFFTLLMILKRMYALFKNEIDKN